jgi:hypothetical protein
MTFDMFNAAGTTFEGAGICGIDRIGLLKGNNPTIVCAQLSSTDYALLPVDLDGSNYPATGAKALYVEQDSVSAPSTSLYMYRAKYDFTARTVVVDSKITIAVTSYNSTICTDTQNCAAQPIHTGSLPSGEIFASESKLDTLAYHLMFRAAYRNFGSYESVTLNGPVTRGSTGTNAAIRWYEIRTPFGTPSVYQQSTYSPDSAMYRWMGSIAQDHQGNMLLGYTGSNSTVFPSVYLTGRLNGDAVNTMQSETQAYAGLNSQVNIRGYAYGYRWGDYSAMMVDPDDCTFWHTNEYLKQAGLFNWSTRVVSYKFPGCTSNASITMPVPSSTLSGSTAIFLWTSGTGTPAYSLAIGKTQGASDYCGGPQSYSAGTYTATLSCLPVDGSTFWVRLATVPGGFQDYQYTAPNLQQSQTITFPNPGTRTYGAAPVALTATASSGLAVTYTVVSGPAAVNGSLLTITGAGSVSVQADQAGNVNWLPAPPVQGTFVVNQAVLTVIADDATMSYGGPLPTFTASYSGFVNGEGREVLTGSPSLTTTAIANSPVGNYPITAAQGSLSALNYGFAFVNGNLNIYSVTALITLPSKGATLVGSTVTFRWTEESGATSYQLWLGRSAGTHDLAVIGTTLLSGTVTTLPTDGSAIYATLNGYAGGKWTVQDTATYTAATIVRAQILSPAKGSTLTGSTVTFSWTGESGATSYQLWLGRTLGAHDLAVIGTTQLSGTVTTLPTDGSQVFATLNGYAGGKWTVQDTASYTALNLIKAAIQSPAEGATLVGSTVTFIWTAETGATSYQLWLGRTAGAHDLAVVGTAQLSATATGLPIDGSPVYATLNGYAGGKWTVQDSKSYTAASLNTATIISPAKGSMLTGNKVTFSWTAETGATSYQLWLGHSAGAHDIAVVGTTQLSGTATTLPTDGSTVYVTLYGYKAGGWAVQDTASYTTGP